MNASISTERLIKDLKLVARDAEDLMRATASDVSEKAKEARARLVAALDTAKLTCEAWQDKAAAGAKAADKWSAIIRTNRSVSCLGLAC